MWADPDVEQAINGMVTLVDDPASGRTVGTSARLHMTRNFSYSAIGMNYRRRLDQIAAGI